MEINIEIIASTSNMWISFPAEKTKKPNSHPKTRMTAMI
jgi:hypothetical protein